MKEILSGPDSLPWKSSLQRLFLGLVAIGGLVTGAGLNAQQARNPKEEYYVDLGQVEPYSGVFQYSHQDIEIGGPQNGGMKFERYYGVRSGGSANFGMGTAHNYDFSVYRDIFQASELHSPSQKSYRFSAIDGATMGVYELIYGVPQTEWRTLYGGKFTISSITGPFTLVDRYGRTIQFGALQSCPNINVPRLQCGKGTSVTYPDGTVETLSYDTAVPGGAIVYPRLRLVKSTRGFALGFMYVSTNSLNISKVCAVNLAVHTPTVSAPCPTGSPAATYAYSGVNQNVLLSYTNAAGEVTSYTHHATLPGALTGIRKSGSSVNDVTLEYYESSGTGYLGNSGRVKRMTYGDGRIWTYAYQQEYPSWAFEGAETNDWTTTTDPNGKTVNYDFFNGMPPKPRYFTDELGRVSENQFSFEWGGSTMVKKAISPEGNYQQFSYDNRDNVLSTRLVAKPASGLADIVSSATFPATCANILTCNKPLTTTDANGNVTSFVYDAAHGGLLTQTGPSVGGIAPVKRLAYVQRFAWIKTTGGGYVQAASPVWLLSEERSCKATATVGNACSGGSADEVITAYDYGPNSGPNNLLLRGKVVTADGISLRTCFGYDYNGRKISETSPNANLTSCP